MMGNRDSGNLPDYKTPPINEVACGISYEKIGTFRGHHIGLFWQKIREEFPDVEHGGACRAAKPIP